MKTGIVPPQIVNHRMNSVRSLELNEKVSRLLSLHFRIYKPLPSLIKNYRNFKSGPDLLNDFGIRKNEALPKRFRPRCNFNHWLAAELELFKRADDIPFFAILGLGYILLSLYEGH